jgi:hypothetical protein
MNMNRTLFINKLFFGRLKRYTCFAIRATFYFGAAIAHSSDLRYGLHDRGETIPPLAGARDYSLLQNVQTDPAAHQPPIQWLHQSGAQDKIHGGVPLLTLFVFVVCAVTSLPLPFTTSPLSGYVVSTFNYTPILKEL